MKTVWKRVLPAIGFQLSAVSWLWACPRCVDATPYKAGLFWAVLFLMPLPFLVVGGVAFWIVRHSRHGAPPVAPGLSQGNK